MCGMSECSAAIKANGFAFTEEKLSFYLLTLSLIILFTVNSETFVST